jgi:outer membrane receptor protein involved in Fe transport
MCFLSQKAGLFILMIKHRQIFQLAILVFNCLSSGLFADQTESGSIGNDSGSTANQIDEIVVTSQRREQSVLNHAGNIAQVDVETLKWLQAQHIHEVMSRVAGAWIVRGSGQEHQTAIRSPVLGGGGACAGFLPLEDGIPVRPAGFCNINQFIEMFTEEARSLHGTVNVLMPMPRQGAQPHVGVEVGANDFFRARTRIPLDKESSWLAAVSYTHDGGFREDSGYEQGKLHIKRGWRMGNGDFMLGFTATDLDQDTAGFVEGKDAYKDPTVNRSNPDPDAFRDVSSQRLYGIWDGAWGDFDLDVRPYVRHSDMEFLHFQRPGKPVEENGHHSAGAIVSLTSQTASRLTIFGFDLDWGSAFMRQTQFEPTPGNPRQRETLPQGKHYDYEVDALNLAAYVQMEQQMSDRVTIGGGLRLEYTYYDYDNRMLDGNTRDDGTPCGFGGCLYTRPADRSDSFTDLAPNLSLTYSLNDTATFFTNLARGFRVPQMIELYRLQFGQFVSDQDSETIDSIEAGVRFWHEDWTAEIAAYAMRKQDSAFRDSEGFNVSGGKSRHHGVELLVDWQFHDDWMFHLNGAYGRHTYDFDAAGRGEAFVSGNDMDTAPRWLGSAELRFGPEGPFDAGLQVVTLDEYYLDSLNRFTYPGHTLLNFRASWEVSQSTAVLMRLYNVTDEVIADRADFGMGDYRYLPGRGRELFVEFRYLP